MGLFILLASFSSANAAPLEAFRTLTSEEYEYGSGASPCDVDADGYDDLVVGASGWGFGGAGAVYVHMGGPDGPAGAGELLVSGETDQTLGIAVACLGDVDRDGYEDVAVADAPEAGAYEYEGTRVHIHHGGPAGLSAEPSLTVAGSLDVYCGDASADIDADGYGDLVLVGGDGLEVYYGAPGGLPAVPDTVIPSWVEGSAVVHAVPVGDLDADGFDDVLAVSGGRGVAVFAGGPTGLDASRSTTITPQTGGRNPAFVQGAGMGDLDGDGFGDLVVLWVYRRILPDRDDVYGGTLWLGSASGPVESAITLPARPARVAPAGDVNGDGYADAYLAIYDASAVYTYPNLYLGPLTSWSSDQLYRLATGAGDYQGPAGPADFNGDAASDFILPEPSESRVFLFRGTEVDGDGDGVVRSEDCDDTDASVGARRVWYADVDRDGYGASGVIATTCDPDPGPDAASARDGDCDDARADVHPTAPETCDTRDQDCDGLVDEAACAEDTGESGTPQETGTPDGAGHTPDTGCGCGAAPGAGTAWMAAIVALLVSVGLRSRAR